MGSDSKYVEFTLDWKLRWADYDRIGGRMVGPRRYFITSFSNVSFKWYAKLFTAENDSKISFGLYYDDGPLDKIKGVEYKIGAVKRDGSLHSNQNPGVHEYPRASDGGLGWGWTAFEDAQSTAVRSKYELAYSDRLTYQITVKIPTEAFAYCIPTPTPTQCGPWSKELFSSINDDDENSWLSGTKVVGRDGIEFTCHKLIAAAQSKALETILRYPPTQEGSDGAAPENEPVSSSPKKRKASEMDEHSTTTAAASVYKFPNLCAASLKAVLEYLYTGKATTSSLSVTELIEMGDAGEQYDLKTVKQFSAAELWRRVVEVEPLLAFEIARFADLHDELKDLKHRALDVIAENYDSLGVKPNELAKRFGGTRGDELRDELVEYMGRRLRPISKE